MEPDQDLTGKMLLPAMMQRRYFAASFAGRDSAAAFAYDSAAQWARVYTDMLEAALPVVDAIADERLRAQETEFFRKASVCWRDVGYGALFVPEESDLVTTNQEQATALEPELRAEGGYFAATIRAKGRDWVRATMDGAAIKLNKGKGAPFFQVGSDRLAGIALATVAQNASTVNDIESMLRGAGASALGFVQSTESRVQGADAAVPRVVVGADGALHIDGVRFGPKVRPVNAQPFVLNHLWGPIGDVLRTLMAEREDGRNTGTTEQANILARAYPITTAIDLKKYDKTVSYETLTTFRQVILEPVLQALVDMGLITKARAKLLLEIDALYQAMPTIFPPRYTRSSVRLMHARGQLRSGENLTSFKGTIINRCLCNLVMSRLGGRMDAVNYGDDTLAFSTREIGQDWVQASADIGFNSELAPDRTFLMKRIPEGYAYLGRMVTACLNREPKDEPDGPFEAASSFTVRRALLRGHPSEHSFLPILRAMSTRAPERFGQAVALMGEPTESVAYMQSAALIAQARRSSNAQQAVLDDMDRYKQVLGDSKLMDALTQKGELWMRRTVAQIRWCDLTHVSAQMGLPLALKYIATTSQIRADGWNRMTEYARQEMGERRRDFRKTFKKAMDPILAKSIDQQACA